MASDSAPADFWDGSHGELSADELGSHADGRRLIEAAAVAASKLEAAQSADLQPRSTAALGTVWLSDGTYCEGVDDLAYAAMVGDKTRTPLFAAAIRRRLHGHPDWSVLDLGTGPECLLGLMAARAGARKVFAIEANAAVAERARAAVAAAVDIAPGVVEVMQGYSTELELPERVDLLVAELVGSVASEEGMVATMRDAQARHLKRPLDPASYIPQRVQTICAPASYVLASLLRPPFAALDFTMSRGGEPVRLGCGDAALQLIAAPCLLEDFNWATAPLPPARRELAFTVDAALVSAGQRTHWEGLAPAVASLGCSEASAALLVRSLAHSLAGLACWPRMVLDEAACIVVESRSDSPLTAGEAASEMPEAGESHWQTVLLLLSSRPLAVRPGDAVRLAFSAAYGQRVDMPTRYELQGELVTRDAD